MLEGAKVPPFGKLEPLLTTKVVFTNPEVKVMKRKLSLTGFLILFLILAAACAGTQQEEVEPTPSPVLQGPALVMFYTDN